MKKLLAVLIAIALIMSMTVVAFANKLIPSSYGDENTATENGDWIDSYSFETTWQDAWKEYIEQQGEEVWSGSVSKDAFEDEIVGEVEAGKVSKDTIIGALDSYLETVNGWGAGAKKDTFTAVIGELKEKVNAVETTTPETTTSGDSGGSGGSGGGSSSAKYTAEEYGKKILDMVAGGSSATDIMTMIATDIASGDIKADQIPDIITYISDNADPSDSTIASLLEYLEGIKDKIPSGGGSIIDNLTLPDFDNFTLPFDIGGSESGGILDTILSALSGVIGGLFGGDDDNGGGNGGGNSDWGNGGDSNWDSGDSDFSNNDTGDISFIAVGAVALVAGAALILTRKKNSEDE